MKISNEERFKNDSTKSLYFLLFIFVFFIGAGELMTYLVGNWLGFTVLLVFGGSGIIQIIGEIRRRAKQGKSSD